MADQLTERLERCYTGIIHDVLREMGLKDFTLPPELRPLLPGTKLAGPAFTIEGKTGEFDAHETLLAWTGLLSRAKPGYVWVSQPNTEECALMGELSAETLKNKGVRGCVIDGLSRDTEFMIEMGFQAFFKAYTPRDIVGFWLPKAVDEPIKIGDVWIRPGDYILGDRDGVVRIPAEIIEEVVTKAETAISAENKVRTAILAGTDPQQAYLQFGKF
ncbi:RraA family protein [Bosea sp. (in: a-proteobacteria)]|uniref:RraA family protein n=1 Tax=Bosea sp. (in: a-proteobacteria) TaxID=1871050 RepID=UPI002FCB40F9